MNMQVLYNVSLLSEVTMTRDEAVNKAISIIKELSSCQFDSETEAKEWADMLNVLTDNKYSIDSNGDGTYWVLTEE